MAELWQQITQVIGGYVPNLLGALAILFIGWIVALIIAGVVRRALGRTTLDDRLVSWIFGDKARTDIVPEKWVAKGVYYLVMLFVLVAFFQALKLTVITEPLNLLLGQVFLFAPRLLGAGMILLAAWLIATILKFVITRAMNATKLDERLTAQAGVDESEGQVSVTESLATGIYWLVFLLFLPAVLGALGMAGLVEPVQGMVSQILSVLPNLLGAGLIVLVGWFVARIVRQIVVSLLTAAGADGLGKRVGLGAEEGQQSLSGLLGMIVYTLVLIPAVIAALNALDIAAISDPATEMLSTLLNAVPAIFGAAVVLGVAYVLGRLVSQLVANILAGVGFNKLLVWLGLGKEPAEGQRTPADIVGYLILVAVMLFAAGEAANILGLSILADLTAEFITFAGQVLLALVVFGVGLYLANLASSVIEATGGKKAALGAQAARIAIIVLVAAMALRQMGIANEIVNLAFGLILGAIAVAVALAFGLGAREIAARQVEKWLKTLPGSDKPGGD